MIKDNNQLTRIYLAARYSRQKELNTYAKQLREKGFIVDAGWLTGAHQASDVALAVETEKDEIPLEGEWFAREDYNDIKRSKWILCFTEKPRSKHGRGGRHVEMGLALAWRRRRFFFFGPWTKRIVVIGPRENVFCCLKEVEHYKNFEDFIQHGIK